MRTIRAGIVILLAMVLTNSRASAFVFPWAPVNQEPGKFMLTWAEIAQDVNVTVGKPFPPWLIHSHLKVAPRIKDARGDDSKLGYASHHAHPPDIENFTTVLDLTGKPAIRLAALADDYAEVTIYAYSDSATDHQGEELHRFATHPGSGLWTDGAFKEDDFTLNANFKYVITVHYENTSHWVDPAIGIDADGVSIYREGPEERVEIQINNTPATSDDIVRLRALVSTTDSSEIQHRFKVPCRARVIGTQTADLVVVITNPDGRLRFPEEKDTIVKLILPKDGSFGPKSYFEISGEERSDILNDAIIQAHIGNSDGYVISEQKATVFYLADPVLLFEDGGNYEIIDNGNGSSTFRCEGAAMNLSTWASVRPDGLSSSAPQLAVLRISLCQNMVGGAEYSATWGDPEVHWYRGIPRVKVSEPSEFKFTDRVPATCGDSQLYQNDQPLYDETEQYPPINLTDGGAADTNDTPRLKLPNVFPLEIIDPSSHVPVGLIKYHLREMKLMAGFRDWCICYDYDPSLHPKPTIVEPLCMGIWWDHVSSYASPADSAHHLRQIFKPPRSWPIFGGDNANIFLNDNGRTIGVHNRFFEN